VPGDFNVTAVTFDAMALFDRLDSGQRARAVVPMDDENRTHWNFLPESGRRGVPVRDLDREQRYLAYRLIAQCMSVEGYAQVPGIAAGLRYPVRARARRGGMAGRARRGTARRADHGRGPGSPPLGERPAARTGARTDEARAAARVR
jgi:hypothetical protein